MTERLLAGLAELFGRASLTSTAAAHPWSIRCHFHVVVPYPPLEQALSRPLVEVRTESCVFDIK